MVILLIQQILTEHLLRVRAVIHHFILKASLQESGIVIKQENGGSESGGILSKDHIVFMEE